MLSAVVGINWGDEVRVELSIISHRNTMLFQDIRAATMQAIQLLMIRASLFLTFCPREFFRTERLMSSEQEW